MADTKADEVRCPLCHQDRSALSGACKCGGLDPRSDYRPAVAAARQHELKTWPTFFDAVRRGDKRFEVRQNDRDYGVGDVLILREWDPSLGGERVLGSRGEYTGRALRCTITYVMVGGQFGVIPTTCVLSLSVPEEYDHGPF